MLNTRPRNSDGMLSWTRVFANGQKNPNLITPTKKKMIHDTQYYVDHANRIRNTQRSSNDPTRSQDLRLKSPSAARMKLPSSEPRPAPSHNRPVPPAPTSSTSLVNAGRTRQDPPVDTPKNASFNYRSDRDLPNYPVHLSTASSNGRPFGNVYR